MHGDGLTVCGQQRSRCGLVRAGGLPLPLLSDADTDPGDGSAALRRVGADRRLDADTVSGCCSHWWRSGRWNRAASWPPHGGWPSGSRSPAVAGSATTRRIGRWTSCSTPWARSPRRIFDSVAHLLNLDVDIVFVDTTSTYWEVDVPDELADLQPEPEADDGAGKPVEYGARRFGKSKDHRDDLPQVVIAMAVTRDGIPVRCWTFPGSESDQRIIRTVKDDLGSWNLHRLVWVADPGSPPPPTAPT